MLGPIEPVSRRGDWSDEIVVEDADDGSPGDLSGATFALSVYARGCCRPVSDYGFRRSGDRALLTLTTATDALVLTGNVLSFAFPAGAFARWEPGPYELSLVMTRDGRERELLREPFTVI